MGMQALDATSMLLRLLFWSNLANQIIAAEDESHISTPQNQSLVLHNSKNFSAFVGGDTFEGENSLELLNDSYSSDEVVTSSREFSDNLKDILRVEEEEEEEGSANAMQDSEHNSYDNYGYSEEENYISEKESDLNDEGDQKRESDFDMTTRSPAFESGEKVSMSEVDLMTREGESSETTTNRSLITKHEDSLVETTLVEESLVECFYVAPSSTFANLPDSISCSCAGTASTFKVDNILVTDKRHLCTSPKLLNCIDVILTLTLLKRCPCHDSLDNCTARNCDSPRSSHPPHHFHTFTHS